MDGSCKPHVFADLSRAAWAAVQIDDQGEITRALTGVVPAHLPQIAQAAEHVAVSVAAGAVSPDNTIEAIVEAW